MDRVILELSERDAWKLVAALKRQDGDCPDLDRLARYITGRISTLYISQWFRRQRD